MSRAARQHVQLRGVDQLRGLATSAAAWSESGWTCRRRCRRCPALGQRLVTIVERAAWPGPAGRRRGPAPAPARRPSGQRLVGVLGAVVAADRRGTDTIAVRGDEHASATRVLLPVPFIPATYQVSLTLSSVIGIRASPWSTCSPLSSTTGMPSTAHCECKQPEAKPQLPVTPGHPRHACWWTGREYAGDAGVGVGVVHVVLRLLGVQADHPGAHVHQRAHPGGRPVCPGELDADTQESAEVALVPAEAGRHREPVEAGVGDRGDVLLDHAPVLLGLDGVGAQQRDESSGTGNQLVGAHCGVGGDGGFGGEGHGVLLTWGDRRSGGRVPATMRRRVRSAPALPDQNVQSTLDSRVTGITTGTSSATGL